MEEIMQKIIDSIRSWLKRVIAAFKSGRYIWCSLVAIAPFAGLWAGAKLFWLCADLIWGFLQRHGEYIVGFLGIPVLIVFCFWWLFIRNNDSTAQEKPKETIQKARVRAETTYPKLQDATFLLFQELCGYLPGLVRPLSPSSITAKVPFDITADFAVIYHFVIGRGDNIQPTKSMQEVLTTIIKSHLAANDLPLAISEEYPASDGSLWPGLFVDNIYAFNNQYRIDLCITEEPESARLRAKNAASLSSKATAITPHDPDFD